MSQSAIIKVHVTHCCVRHGCKYGYAQCPVVTVLETQKYPCEACEDDANEHCAGCTCKNK